jgi:hypothetical protein
MREVPYRDAGRALSSKKQQTIFARKQHLGGESGSTRAIPPDKGTNVKTVTKSTAGSDGLPPITINGQRIRNSNSVEGHGATQVTSLYPMQRSGERSTSRKPETLS